MTELTANLANVATQWSRILQAQDTKGDTAVFARNELLVRYHEAVLRYLRGELRDDNAAGQLYSDFAVRILEVDAFLKRADPDRGRFRDYLKSVLRHMVIDYYRAGNRQRKKEQELLLGGAMEPVAAPDAPEDEDHRFTQCWRQELVNQTWRALEDAEKRGGQPWHTVLHLQGEHPALRSAQIAEKLAALVGRPFSAEGVRKLVQRAREMFGDLLLQEVARSLQTSATDRVGAERLEQELIELGLLFKYCKEPLKRYAAH
jgi:RNA polymerase sigma-70 factor (ECF subfamily)